MPGLDGTGPAGQGPMTGGGFGRCANNSAEISPRGRGLARGRCRGNRYNATQNVQPLDEPGYTATVKNDEMPADSPRSRLESLELQFKEAQKQIDELKEENDKLRRLSEEKDDGKQKKIKRKG